MQQRLPRDHQKKFLKNLDVRQRIQRYLIGQGNYRQ